MIINIDRKIEELRIGFVGTFAQAMADHAAEVSNISSPIVVDDINSIDDEYDLVFGAGLYEIIPDHVLHAPKYGMLFFHATPLPEGKGNAPIYWTVSNKRNNIL